MGSMVVNYYRKRDQQDEHVPKVCKTFNRRFGSLVKHVRTV
jgi:hypothetical protein